MRVRSHNVKEEPNTTSRYGLRPPVNAHVRRMDNKEKRR